LEGTYDASVQHQDVQSLGFSQNGLSSAFDGVETRQVTLCKAYVDTCGLLSNVCDCFHAALHIACGDPDLCQIMLRQFKAVCLPIPVFAPVIRMTLLVREGTSVAGLYALDFIPVDELSGVGADTLIVQKRINWRECGLTNTEKFRNAGGALCVFLLAKHSDSFSQVIDSRTGVVVGAEVPCIVHKASSVCRRGSRTGCFNNLNPR
jgi:hypothetical protein